MDVENHLYPTQSHVAELLGDDSADRVVMLNLLKFRENAEYADGRASDLSGREAYNLYGVAMQAIVENNGGRVVFGGDIASVVIGEVGELWDTCVLVEYPSAAAFATLVTSAEVLEASIHRAAGLEGQLLLRVAQRGAILS
jgi:uncharacterized protein (DUF1330 family)